MIRKVTTIAEATKLADEIRGVWPEKAAQIDALIFAACKAGKTDGINFTVGIKYKLEKFDGEYVPGKTPVEVIEGTG